MSYRKLNGRPISRVYAVKTTADVIRKHLRANALTITHDLAKWWDLHPNSAHRRLYKGARPLTPIMVDKFIEHCQLDEEEAAELHQLAAKEFGFRIDPPKEK